MSSQDGRRSLRVAEIVRAEFARAVQRRIDDARLRGVMVANVKVSDDLQVIDLGVRFPTVEDAAEQEKLVKKLGRALPRLTREIMPRLELRRVPLLRLHYDAGQDQSRRVEELLREIKEEKKPK
ncbi:MAG: 30S ribosome-binding factor RbfA [Polyangiaceae bacterium]